VTSATDIRYPPGALVAARGREWVVLPDSTERFLVARPLNGDTEFTTGLFPHEVLPARFPQPSRNDGEAGDHLAAGLLRTALRIGFTSSASPLRSIASIAVEPRQYQLVPLLLALRMHTVRLLIADDVGIGKTIEAALIAKELIEQGDARRLVVLCSPALAEQWRRELAEKFAINATLVLPSTITRLERPLPADRSVFEEHPYTVVSTDFIKAERRRAQFIRACPDLVIVDEAHTCVGTSAGRTRQLRHELLRDVAADPNRHLILVTATPHSGNEEAFRDLLGLLNPNLANLPLDDPRGRTELARHFVQRRRRDIRSYLDQDTPFPKDRQVREVAYELHADYARFTREILDYARESVRDGYGVRQRVRWWSALALLRSVASSPDAAAATLLARSVAATAETDAEADQLGRASVLDLIDEPLEGLDATPGADDDQFPPGVRDRLRRYARQARQLSGITLDAKLATLVREVTALLADGYDPIVFCRFIPTAEYVAEHLTKALGRKVAVEAVTGTLPPAERLARIDTLTEQAGRHVLVATDCLSEGVNLQEHFQAVIHYDLAWNPTRHEQREGRVDRFGQRRSYVRAVTLYGLDNWIDGVVLDVLIRKHRTIARQTGVAVPVPEQSDSLLKALMEGVLLRQDHHPDQLTLDLDLTEQRDALHREWESAAEREAKTLTKYAQSGVKLDDVQQELTAIRHALGSPADMAHFVRASLTGLGAGVNTDTTGFRVPAQGLPPGARRTLGLTGDDDRAEVRFRYDLPVKSGEHVLVRTDPTVAALARHVLETALDPQATSPAARCGVVRTAAVPARTVLLLVRYRFHLTLPGQVATRDVVAEDAQVVAYRAGADGQRVWLDDRDAAMLLDSSPDANVLPELVTRTIDRALGELDQTQDDLDERGRMLAERLRDAHRRIRGAVGARIAGLKVTPGGPADVLGVYVYLPAGGTA